MPSINLIESLRIFRKIVDAGTFTRAAHDLRISAAWAARSLDRLESHLGVALLHRTTRHLHLTEAGKRCYEISGRMLDDLEELEAALGDSIAVPRGRIRISAPMSFGICELGPIVNEFTAAYPEIAIELVLNDRMVNLVEEGFDLALRITSNAPDSGLLARKLSSVPRLACASPTYLAMHGQPAHPEELGARSCLVFSLMAQPNVWRFHGRDGEITVQPKPQVLANNSLLLKTLLIAGAGIALIPEFIVREELRQGAVVPVLQDFSVDPLSLFLMRSNGRQPPRRVSLFIDAIIRGLGRPQLAVA